MDVVAPGWVNGGANTWMVDQGNVASPLTCFFLASLMSLNNDPKIPQASW